LQVQVSLICSRAYSFSSWREAETGSWDPWTVQDCDVELPRESRHLSSADELVALLRAWKETAVEFVEDAAWKSSMSQLGKVNELVVHPAVSCAWAKTAPGVADSRIGIAAHRTAKDEKNIGAIFEGGFVPKILEFAFLKLQLQP